MLPNDSGESNNPANALKALIYRLRTILKNNLGEYDYILSSQGTYYWNPEYYRYSGEFLPMIENVEKL